MRSRRTVINPSGAGDDTDGFEIIELDDSEVGDLEHEDEFDNAEQPEVDDTQLERPTKKRSLPTTEDEEARCSLDLEERPRKRSSTSVREAQAEEGMEVIKYEEDRKPV